MHHKYDKLFYASHPAEVVDLKMSHKYAVSTREIKACNKNNESARSNNITAALHNSSAAVVTMKAVINEVNYQELQAHCFLK